MTHALIIPMAVPDAEAIIARTTVAVVADSMALTCADVTSRLTSHAATLTHEAAPLGAADLVRAGYRLRAVSARLAEAAAELRLIATELREHARTTMMT